MEKGNRIPESSANIQARIDRARNEQQKAVLLRELAKSRCENESRHAIDRSEDLLKASGEIQKRSLELRKKK